MSILEQLNDVYMGEIKPVFPSLYSWDYEDCDLLIKVNPATGQVYTKFRLAPDTDWVEDVWKVKL